MPALSRRYRREVIELTCKMEPAAIKDAVLSSIEMTETFLYFMDDKEFVITYDDGKIEIGINNHTPGFEVDNDKNILWAVPFIRKIKIVGLPCYDFLAALHNFNHLQELDLTLCCPAFYQIDAFWRLVLIASKVSMHFRMLTSAAWRFRVLPKADILNITFDRITKWKKPNIGLRRADYITYMLSVSILNVPNLIFDFTEDHVCLLDFVSGYAFARHRLDLDKTRTISIELSYWQGEEYLLRLLINVRRMASKLEAINVMFVTPYYSPPGTTAAQLLAHNTKRFTEMSNFLRDLIPNDIKVVIRHCYTVASFNATADDLRIISEAGYDVFQRFEGDRCTASATMRQTEVAPNIEFHLSVDFC